MMEFEFSTLSEYLGLVAEIPSMFNCHSSDLWYRGIKDENLKLIPGIIWRNISTEREESIIAEFLRYASNYSTIRPKSAFEQYVLMQHYGLPTRLLDWSLSPLISLYFALEKEIENSSQRIVWVIDPREINNKSIGFNAIISPNQFKLSMVENYLPKYLRSSTVGIPNTPVAIELPLMNQRVTAQKGVFTMHGYNTESIDEYYNKHKLNHIAKLKIRSESNRKKLLQDLYSIGFKEDDIYQDLNSLSSRIIREYDI